MNITIKDIARVAGVSYSTVSKALNNSPLVKDKTKQKIMNIAKEMGYEPNFAAQRLVTNQTKIIGLIWPTIERATLSTLVTKISDKINETAYSMILSVDPVQTSLDTFKRFQVDGIILFEEYTNEDIHPNTIPLLAYGVVEKEKKLYPKIDPNHNQAMDKAISYLIKLGHQKIAFIGDLSSTDPMQIEKNNGFKQTMDHYGLLVNKSHLIDTNGLDWFDGYTATKKLLESSHRPTAIVGASYDISGGIIRGLKEQNLHIPNDISVISYDNIPQMSNLEVPLTCIGIPIDQLATSIVESIIDQIEKGTFSPNAIKLTPELFIRKSCSQPKREADDFSNL